MGCTHRDTSVDAFLAPVLSALNEKIAHVLVVDYGEAREEARDVRFGDFAHAVLDSQVECSD